MKKLLMFAAMAVSTGCLPEQEQSMIVVDGEGVVMATPDTFNLQAEIHANADAKSDALKAVSQTIDQIGARPPALVGLDAVEINSASVAVAPVRDNQCVKDADYTQRDACPIIRFRASARMEIKGAAATTAGNALSFLSELGVAEVQLTGYSFSDLDKQRTEATVAALTDARAKAERPSLMQAEHWLTATTRLASPSRARAIPHSAQISYRTAASRMLRQPQALASD